MLKKEYRYGGGEFVWDFVSDHGPRVTITAAPEITKDAGEFKCQKSPDGCYDVLIRRPLTKPIAKRVLELINACKVAITKIAVIVVLVCGIAFPVAAREAQTKFMEVQVYYISREAQADPQLEQLARRLLAAAEKKINTDILPPSARLEFRIISFTPWNPPGLITYEVRGRGTVTDYNDLLSRLRPIHNRFPASQFTLALTRGYIGFWNEAENRAYTAFGAIDQNDRSRILLANCDGRSFPALLSTLLHEFGHMAEVPDRYDEVCKKKTDIMCKNTNERELRPIFNVRYRKSFYAFIWFLRAKSSSTSINQ